MSRRVGPGQTRARSTTTQNRWKAARNQGATALNPLTPNPYCTESLPCAEGLGGAAAERNKRFFPKITACLVFKIKSSFFSPFLVNGYILSCKCQKCKKIILSYIYMSSYVIAKMKFSFFRTTSLTSIRHMRNIFGRRQ